MASRSRALAATAAAAAAAAAAYYLYRRYASRSKSEESKMVLRSAYEPSAYKVETVKLDFILTEEEAVVKSVVKFAAYEGTAAKPPPLYLDGEELELRSIAINGTQLVKGRDYVLGAEEGLTVLAPPAAGFELAIVVANKPQDNTQLSGLYKTSGNYCTQCEAVGFRRITYFLDRPDVMAKYTVRVEADKALYPVLLSNGNETARGELAGGRHWASFEDPFKKPCYLFALVAASLQQIESSFTTCSGRKVAIHIWSEPENVDQLDWAMQSLKDAMAWDEKTFGREYDLDVYHIVAVNDFNMGAMENKGLNVFNTSCVLAKQSAASDADFERVQGVVAHEYFHNWTGNRVTCRDWFQLTLKEGLTVYRDSSFSADMTSEAVKRIEDVRVMRAHQFVEDAGPMAHPIRPESYLAIDNFYTITVYEKGSEVIRMYHTLLGAAGFRKGMDLYFSRHDGQAVTCDDFRAAMADANGKDLTQFERWYTQAGTPTVKAVGTYDAGKRSYTLQLSQSTPATPGQPSKLPFHIPVKIKLLDGAGGALLPERVLELTQESQAFVFTHIPSAPVLSLLRGFSAPVKVDMPLSDATLELLAAHDDDPFNRWDASQQLASRVLLELIAKWQAAPTADARAALVLPAAFVRAFKATLTSGGLEPSLQAYALTLPEYSVLSQEVSPIDPDAIVGVLRLARRTLATALRAEFTAAYTRLAPPKGEKFTVAREAVGKRRLRNVCLDYLSTIGDEASQALGLSHFKAATTMTDSLAALKALDPHAGAPRTEVSKTFYERAKANSEALVINKWFAVQASTFAVDSLQRVEALMKHEAYDGTNPNRVRAVVSMFAMANPTAFHALDGSGYDFIAAQVLDLGQRNPQVAARLCKAFSDWKKYDGARQALMKAALVRIRDAKGVSKDVLEVATRSIEG
jgi:aminopeptidase N